MDNREKLVELFAEAARICGKSDCCMCRYFNDQSCVDALLIDHLINNGVTVQEWIPVSEPPKKNGRYYVHFKMHDISYVKIASFSKESVAGLHDNGWHDYDSDVGFYEVKDVTHWMPLPTPPKQEG